MKYERESLEYLQQLSRAVIADGEFLSPGGEILNLSEKLIPKITALEIYFKELSQYLNFIRENQN